jgi:hypothetical protein
VAHRHQVAGSPRWPGFEGGTKIHLNTISPDTLKRRVLASLLAARDEDRLAPGIRLGNEVRWERNCLRYNPAIR